MRKRIPGEQKEQWYPAVGGLAMAGGCFFGAPAIKEVGGMISLLGGTGDVVFYGLLFPFVAAVFAGYGKAALRRRFSQTLFVNMQRRNVIELGVGFCMIGGVIALKFLYRDDLLLDSLWLGAFTYILLVVYRISVHRFHARA